MDADSDGLQDYAGEFKRDFSLNDLAHNILARHCKKLALDVHLLNRACYTSVVERWGEDAQLPMAIEQWRAMAPITIHRLRKTFAIEGEDMSSVLKILQLNPFLPRDYLKLEFELVDETRGLVWLKDCAALRESAPRGIVSLLTHFPETPGFDAMAQAVNPFARIRQTDAGLKEGAAVVWEVVIDHEGEAATVSDYAGLVAGSDLTDFNNENHVYHYQ
jgi:hypothetical protein